MGSTPGKYELIITIVEKGLASDVIDAAKEGGAEGATILHGRGSGIHEKAKFFGIVIEPEKDIVLIMVPETIRDQVLDAIDKGVDINKPGNGVCFVLDINKIIGIRHLDLCGKENTEEK